MPDPHALTDRRSRRGLRRRAAALGALAAGAVVATVLVVSASHQPGRGGRAAAGATPAQHRARHARHHHPRPVDRRTGLRRPAGVAATVPILMYHVINAPPPGAPFPQLYVPRAEFAAQVRALYRAGWTAVTMDQLWDAWKGVRRLPPGRPVVISFDNGYRSQYLAAFPVLRRYHWPGVENLQLTGLPRSQGGISRRQVRRLVTAGWELDTQGFSHADLPTLGDAALRHEVAGARRVVERRWGVPVHWFCYPSGHYDARVVAQVRAAGYRGSTTVVPGWAAHGDDPFRLPRLRVVRGTTPAGLEAQIAAARHASPAPPSYGA